MERMNPEVKRQWLEALRGGEYTQGASALSRVRDRDGNREYCCLGVLCDLAEKAGVVSSKLPDQDYVNRALDRDGDAGYNGDVFYSDPEGRFEEASSLPVGVQEWAGLPRDPYVFFSEDIENVALSELNDDVGEDFNQIADRIEESL